MVEKCRNGHIRTPENTVWERGTNGHKRRRCKDCRRESQERRLQQIDSPIAPHAFPTIRTRDQLTPSERVITSQFGRMLELTVTPCHDKPDEFTDYEENNEEIPSPKTARKMCNGCKVIELCRQSAKIMREGWGVWGGEVFVMGEVYYAGKKDG